MNGPLAMLADLRTALEAGRPVSPATGSWLLDSVGRYLDHGARAGQTIGQCLSLEPAHPHARPWAADDAEAIRADLVRRLTTHFPCRSSTGRAKAIAAAALEYAKRWEDRDKFLSAMPADYEGTADEILFQLHRIPCDSMTWPLGWRRIYALMKDKIVCNTSP